MASPQTIQPDALSDNSPATELDIYAAEFAKLVDRYSPSRSEQPSDWLARLPNEAFHYFDRGISTFGREAESPIHRRGRLYLVHTALVLMWMSWGKTTARDRFQSDAHKGTSRAASLITLEHYRRGDVLTDFTTYDWFFQPVKEWTVSLNPTAIDLSALPQDGDLRATLRGKDPVQRPVPVLSRLRSTGAVPSRHALCLEDKEDV